MSRSPGPGRPPKPGAKTATICAKISEADHDVIKERCARLGITPSAWLQDLIAESLGNAEPCPHRLHSGAWCKQCGKTKT